MEGLNIATVTKQSGCDRPSSLSTIHSVLTCRLCLLWLSGPMFCQRDRRIETGIASDSRDCFLLNARPHDKQIPALRL